VTWQDGKPFTADVRHRGGDLSEPDLRAVTSPHDAIRQHEDRGWGIGMDQ
jgi:hypothetical protein